MLDALGTFGLAGSDVWRQVLGTGSTCIRLAPNSADFGRCRARRSSDIAGGRLRPTRARQPLAPRRRAWPARVRTSMGDDGSDFDDCVCGSESAWRPMLEAIQRGSAASAWDTPDRLPPETRSRRREWPSRSGPRAATPLLDLGRPSCLANARCCPASSVSRRNRRSKTGGSRPLTLMSWSYSTQEAKADEHNIEGSLGAAK